jgi:hypothetical protein
MDCTGRLFGCSVVLTLPPQQRCRLYFLNTNGVRKIVHGFSHCNRYRESSGYIPCECGIKVYTRILPYFASISRGIWRHEELDCIATKGATIRGHRNCHGNEGYYDRRLSGEAGHVVGTIARACCDVSAEHSPLIIALCFRIRRHRGSLVSGKKQRFIRQPQTTTSNS